MAELGSLHVSLSLDASNFNGSIAQVNRSMRAMGGELQSIRARGKEYENSIDGLSKKQDVLQRSLNASSIKLQETRKRYDELVASGKASDAQIERAAIAVNRAQAEYNRLEKELSDVTRELKTQSSTWTQAGKQLETISNKIKSVGSGLKDMGKELSMKVTAPIVALGTGAVKASVDFESAFAGVKKTVDTTEEGFAKLRDGIRDMAKELPASASEIASVAESAGQLGIAEENILSFTRTIIDLGEATNLTAEQGATEFARFANIVGMSQQDFDKLGSSIVALGNTMATTEAEIMSMGMRLAAQGAQVGMTEAQILALAGAMSSLGIQSEMGGTAMTTILKKIQTAVGEGGEALQGFAQVANMSSEEFKKAFETDAVSALDAFIKGLAKSSEEGANLTTILGELGIKGVYESDVLLRLAGASDLLSEAVATSTKAWQENTALSDEAAQRYETTASKLEMLKNQIVDIGITLGDILLPIVNKVIEFVGGIVEKFSNLSLATQSFILAVSGIAAAIGPVLVIIGALVASIGQIVGAFGAVSLAIGQAGGVVALLSSKLAFLGPVFTALTGPIGIAVAAITGVVTAVVLAYNKVEWFRDGVNAIFNRIKDVTSTVFTAIKNTITTLISSAVDFGQDILGKFKDFWDSNGKEITTIVKMVFDTIKTRIEVTLTVIKGIFEAVWPIISNVVKVAFEFIQLTISNVLDIILGIISAAMKLLQGDWKGAWEAIKGIAENIMGNIIKFFQDIDLVQIGKDIIQGLINGIGSMTEAVIGKVKELGNNIVDGFKSFFKIQSPSRLMMVFGKYIGQGVAVGIGNAKRDNQKAVQELGQVIINATNKYESELAKLRRDYDKAEKKDREKINNDIIKLQEGFDKEKLSAIQDFLKRKKELEGISLVDEAKVWEESLKHFQDGTNEKIQAQINYKNALKAVNDEIVSINQEYSNKILEVNENLKAREKELTETYTNAVDDRAKSLMNFAGLFDEFDVKFDVSGKKLLKNLQDQVDGFKTWQEEIEKLSQRAIDEGLLEELRQMGPEALPQLVALNKLTDDELTKYSDLYKEKSELARQQATNELEWLKRETDAKLVALNVQTRIQLTQLQGEWTSRIKAITQTTEEEFGSMHDIGVNAMQGLSDGLSSMEPKLMSQARRIANKIRKEIERALDIRSPSRVMKGIGVYIGQGLIDGMEATVAQVANASAKLAESATSGFGGASTSTTSIDNSRHFQPTVTIHTTDSGARAMERTLRKMAFEFN